MIDLQSWSRALNASIIESASMKSLEDVAREAYRDIFKQAVADGTARPLLLTHMLMPMLMPPLWLSIPHTRRNWLYSTRWAVVALVLLYNAYHLLYVSSSNFACMYAAGLASTWASMLSMNLLIWTRPQFDAARVIRVRKSKPGHSNGGGADGAAEHSEATHQNGRRKSLSTSGSLILLRVPFWNDLAGQWTCYYVFEAQAGTGQFHNYHGQQFPRRFAQETKRGLTEAQFIWDRTLRVLFHYLVLDFLAMMMVKDPYFILGPDHHNYELPPLLQAMPLRLLVTYRLLTALLAVISAIDGMFSVGDLVQYFVINRLFPSRGAYWHYASIFGSFDRVLERGLAGWWGSFWHQTFRVQFIAPVTYLLREGYLKRSTQFASLLAILVAFFNSGILHASGSVTAIPTTKPWRSVAFFMLQVVGILLQRGANKMIRPYMPDPPRMLYRTANFLFVFLWLCITAPLFVDDMTSTGIWLFEPVPVSVIRVFGFGQPGEHWWRWDRDAFPRFHVGEHWWQSGVAI
ncbi:hypothetical protein PT974_09139 [Cladobotryum mycophilum]|uniref:Wax synthase domain-containing protein n=1 Tax=Cladobotryum mycophilum TaxID=491253 RepID=A0ABR0SFE3_9HYPO